MLRLDGVILSDPASRHGGPPKNEHLRAFFPEVLVAL